MNTTALIEKRDLLKEKAKKILDKGIVEKRELNKYEDSELSKLEREIDGLNNLISMVSKRNEEENEENYDVVRNVLVNAVDTEKRAIEQLIKNETGKEEYRQFAGMTTTGHKAIIPTHLYKEVMKRVDQVAPLWSRINKIQSKSNIVSVLQEVGIPREASFIGEDDADTSMDMENYQFDNIILKQKRCGAYLQLTQYLINDSGIDIVDYSTDFLYNRIARGLERGLIIGRGENHSQPQFQGLMMSSDKTYVYTKNIDKANIDDYMNTLNSMNPKHQDGSVWIMSNKEFSRMNLLKDEMGNYYMVRDMIDGTPQYKLFGYEILISDFMDDWVGNDASVVSCFVNLNEAFAAMINKQVEFKKIDSDTVNSINGTVTLMIDTYADAKIKNEDAIRILKRPIATLEEPQID